MADGPESVWIAMGQTKQRTKEGLYNGQWGLLFADSSEHNNENNIKKHGQLFASGTNANQIRILDCQLFVCGGKSFGKIDKFT